MKLIFVAALFLVLTGCASFGKGIAEAVLESQEKEGTKICEIIGKSFGGIEPSFAKMEGKTKVLQIHGVGNHEPGYSTEFLDKLADELDMPVRNSNYKEIQLTNRRFPDKKLGVLRVKRLLNEEETRELLFYELTWSEITAKKKAELNYDTSGEYSYNRADINDILKKFSNDTSPDPMIYLGHRHDEILASFTTAFCWMISADWDQLPEKSNQNCNPLTEEALTNLSTDDYSFVSHSLGSRIMIDGMQSIAKFLADKDEQVNLKNKEALFIDELRNKQITIYMLSNQLPLLQMGRKPPEVIGESGAYCSINGIHYNDRIVDKTSIIAFSDPNDLLSYAIPEGFVEKNLDSRLCIDITNITINVVDVFDLFGFGELASPIGAHTAYDSDDRVVALIAKGVGNPKTAPLIQKKCKWTRLID